ncbi:hypothetical protein [Candidatus Leptofilum sp.]|uniref:hypothetical protein n=1 Tax=Candidatus Leptofilum sp. TaxID=3241576 RepID=UPI003B5A0C0E
MTISSNEGNESGNPGRLLYLLDEYFNRSELESLCFNLDVEFENLKGEIRIDKARELILHMYRKGELERLLSALQNERPNVEWPKISMIYPEARRYSFIWILKSASKLTFAFVLLLTIFMMQGDEITIFIVNIFNESPASEFVNATPESTTQSAALLSDGESALTTVVTIAPSPISEGTVSSQSTENPQATSSEIENIPLETDSLAPVLERSTSEFPTDTPFATSTLEAPIVASIAATPTVTLPKTGEPTNTPSPNSTATLTPSSTPTETYTPTPTSNPTNTPTLPSTPTPLPTPTSTHTPSPTPTLTHTPTITPSSTPEYLSLDGFENWPASNEECYTVTREEGYVHINEDKSCPNSAPYIAIQPPGLAPQFVGIQVTVQLDASLTEIETIGLSTQWVDGGEEISYVYIIGNSTTPQQGTISIIPWQGGSGGTESTYSVPFSLGTPYVMRVEKSGLNLNFYFDGNLITTRPISSDGYGNYLQFPAQSQETVNLIGSWRDPQILIR